MFDNPRLLIVDDEDVVCQACRRIFSPQGFQVEGSTDAREGLGLAREGDYSAILLDIKMPQMDGIQFLEELRKEDPNVPVILITGHPSIPNAASAVRLNASDYITKPFTPEEITQAVQRSVARRDVKGEDSKRRRTRRILVVGSEPDFVETAQEALEIAFEVIPAQDREQCLDTVAEQLPDLIVLGYLEPRGTSFQLHKELRQGQTTKDIPIVVVDARPDEHSRKGWTKSEGMQMDAEDYISRPVEPAMFRGIVAQILRTRGQVGSAQASPNALMASAEANQQ